MPEATTLRFFISSTFGLEKERTAVQKLLIDWALDGRRYEEWPEPSGDPMQACLNEVTESDCVILLLGTEYGTPTSHPWSGTETEFRYALKHHKPVLAFELPGDKNESQRKFIEYAREEATYFASVATVDELERQLRAAVVGEVTRRWRAFPERPVISIPWHEPEAPRPMALPDDRESAVTILNEAYGQRDDERIRSAALDLERRFSDDIEALLRLYQAEVNRGLADDRVRVDMIERAASFFEKLAEEGTRYRQDTLHYCHGNALYVLKRYDEAIAAYRTALVANPSFVECWKNLASVYHDKGQLSEARQAYERTLELDPHKFEALYSLGALLIRLGEYQRGLEHLQAIDASPISTEQLSSIRSWQCKGYRELGELRLAIEAGEDAIHLRPSRLGSWRELADLYVSERHRDSSLDVQAVRFWERYIDRFPNTVEAWNELGFLLFRLREQRCKSELGRRARLSFEKLVELGVDDDLVWDRIGHLWQDEGQWQKALDAYERAARANPAAHGYCYAYALRQLGRYEEALPFAKAAAETHQPDSQSWILYADCLDHTSQIDAAASAYRKAIDLDEQYVDAWFDLGGLYWNHGMIDQALDQWVEAIRHFPDAPQARRVKDSLENVLRSDEASAAGASAAERPA